MTFDLDFDRNDLRRQVNKGRVYVWPPGSPADGDHSYLSVTTALQALPKEALIYWAAKVVAETAVGSYRLLGDLMEDSEDKAVKWLKGAPWSSRDRAGLYGSLLHEYMEALASDDKVGQQYALRALDPAASRKAAQLAAFYHTIPGEIVDIETVLFNDTHRWAGTADLIVRFEDERILSMLGCTEPQTFLLDVKSGKGVYPETALQLAAYCHAEDRLDVTSQTREPMYPIDGAAVIHITETSWAMIPVLVTDEVYEVFVDALQLSRSLPLDNQLIGLPLMRGKA